MLPLAEPWVSTAPERISDTVIVTPEKLVVSSMLPVKFPAWS